MLKIKNLTYTYPNGTTALKNINTEIQKTHIFAIMGSSGSGKTTMLNCIGKFLKPDTGSILINGKNIYNIEERVLREKIGIVFQQLYLFPHLTVLENMILAPMKVLKQDREKAKKEAVKTLKKLGINELKNSYPSQISGGQAQRVAIARALILKPSYLLLDEPTSALDVNTTGEFGKWLVDLKEETTFVIVTHDVPFASEIATSGVLMANGKIEYTGSIKDILKTLNIKT
ncbi:MAG: ATP-binding cassette domain-containing protein [bacterium]|nr:ATP-binding cassette domain-containing protein [bacterium]